MTNDKDQKAHDDAIELLSELLMQRLSKSPELAAKQKRLLQMLADDEAPQLSAPLTAEQIEATKPRREQFADQETFEEALSRWMDRQGRSPVLRRLRTEEP